MTYSKLYILFPKFFLVNLTMELLNFQKKISQFYDVFKARDIISKVIPCKLNYRVVEFLEEDISFFLVKMMISSLNNEKHLNIDELFVELYKESKD